ncbi:DUF1353 domain-containing protein [Mesobacterium sp. TK19101]|uniref:DUF1353 domain-containing protein n=1 Tax=Mesobacterium hydrothermale TaxID=3111907 RepID=A0ABU6HLE1_9RHOB|nr:DUF1353 domain-containing protein [Mesobacterium sp. TK19101]MEC3862268.1 DUF1353 domain-containing protein [Mesobacterium sp. TK19101]
MTDTPSSRFKRARKTLLIGGGAVVVLAGLGYWAFPVPPALSCGGVPEKGRCLFLGAPLQIAGTPVFLPPKQQAFFPTQAPLEFIDARGTVWIAPPNTLTDGATIPPYFEPLVGDRQSREYLLAAALHDAYCGIGNDALETFQTRPWPEVHRMFYEALLVNGTTPAKAKIMFAAVYLGGPRWNDPERSLDRVSVAALQQELEWCLKWLDGADPSVDRIEEWMRGREAALRNGTQAEPDWEALFADRA